MTNLPRRTVTLQPDINQRIINLRKTDKYCACTLSEITRRLIEVGLKIEEKKAK